MWSGILEVYCQDLKKRLMVENIYTVDVQEKPLADIVEIRSARRPKQVAERPFDSSLPYINIQSLELGESEQQYADVSGVEMTEKDLVIVKDGYRSGKVFYAKEGIAASTLAVLMPKNDDVLTTYLYCYLSYCYDDFQKRLKGSTIGHLDMNYLRQLVIPVPDIRIQNEVAEKYQRIKTLTDELREKALKLKELSIELSSKELKSKCDDLNLQAEMTLKSWLHQIFKKTV